MATTPKPTAGKTLLYAGIGVLVSLAAIAFIAAQTDLTLFNEALRGGRYIWLIPSAALVTVGLMARAQRWLILLGGGLSWMRAFNIVNVAYLINGIVPLRAGELARAFLASRAQPPIPVFKSISTIVVERLLDLLAVLAILALALTAAPLPDELRAAAGVFAPLSVIGFVMLVLLAARRDWVLKLLTQMTARVSVLARVRLVELAAHFLDGLAPLTHPRALLNALLWTAISWAFSLASGYVLMFAFFDSADWATTALFTAAASFAVAVPAVPGNLGTYELSIVLALGAMGYGEPYSTAAAFAVVVHGVNLGVNALLGGYGLVAEGVSLAQLSQGVRGMRE